MTSAKKAAPKKAAKKAASKKAAKKAASKKAGARKAINKEHSGSGDIYYISKPKISSQINSDNNDEKK